MCLFFGENADKFLEIGNTAASKKLEKCVIAVTWLYNVVKVFFLWPRDTSGIGKLSDKQSISVNVVQQLCTISIEPALPSFI